MVSLSSSRGIAIPLLFCERFLYCPYRRLAISERIPVSVNFHVQHKDWFFSGDRCTVIPCRQGRRTEERTKRDKQGWGTEFIWPIWEFPDDPKKVKKDYSIFLLPFLLHVILCGKFPLSLELKEKWNPLRRFLDWVIRYLKKRNSRNVLKSKK